MANESRSSADAKRARQDRVEARRQMAKDRKSAGRDAWWRRGLRIARRETGGLAVRLALPTTLRTLAASWRMEREGVEHFEAAIAGEGFLAAMWHGRMLAPLPVHRGRGIGVLVSPSRDGALVELVLRRFGYRVIRGSSSKGAPRALREMREQLAGGGSVVITPDGPRGPRHSVNVGLAWLARETGLPILPVGVACESAWRLKSWDRFMIPKPRARVAVVYQELQRIAPTADDAELERVTARIRDLLFEAERQGFERLGSPPDW